jgi:hypothetical protein
VQGGRWTSTIVYFISLPFPPPQCYEHPIPVVARSKEWFSAARLLGLRVRVPPGTWMSVCCECSVLWSGGLCIQRSPTGCGVSECDFETSKTRRRRPTWAVEPQKENFISQVSQWVETYLYSEHMILLHALGWRYLYEFVVITFNPVSYISSAVLYS